MSLVPTIDVFAEVLSKGPHWYDLGIFLGVRTQDLDSISRDYRLEGTTRCLIELYKCAEKEKHLSWEQIVEALKRLRNHSLADEIQGQYMIPSQNTPESSVQEAEESVSNNVSQPAQQHSPASSSSPGYMQSRQQSSSDETTQSSSLSVENAHKASLDVDQSLNKIKVHVPSEVANMFLEVTKKFAALTVKVQCALRMSNIHPDDLQHVITQTCDLEPLEPLSGEQEVPLDRILKRLSSHYCFLKLHTLEFLIDAFLSGNESLQREVNTYKVQLDNFKGLSTLRHLVDLVKVEEGNKMRQMRVTLKLRDFWSRVILKKFEKAMQEMFQILYDCASHITVKQGCICVSWLIPDKTNLITPEPKDKVFMKVIGVVSLHIGDSVVYDIPGEGCEILEAAMLQAIELENTRAVEVLLLLGCDPEIATHNESIAVTNIVNIRESRKTAGCVEHICVFGQDQNIQAILSTSDSDQQTVDDEREWVKHNLLQENDVLKSALKKKEQELKEAQKSTEAGIKEAGMQLLDALKNVQGKEQELVEVRKSTEAKIKEAEQQKFDALIALEHKELELQKATETLRLTEARLKEAEVQIADALEQHDKYKVD